MKKRRVGLPILVCLGLAACGDKETASGKYFEYLAASNRAYACNAAALQMKLPDNACAALDEIKKSLFLDWTSFLAAHPGAYAR